MVQLLQKTIWWFLKELDIDSLYDPAISLLGIKPKELKAGPQTDTCILMFITALFPTSRCFPGNRVAQGFPCPCVLLCLPSGLGQTIGSELVCTNSQEYITHICQVEVKGHPCKVLQLSEEKKVVR